MVDADEQFPYRLYAPQQDDGTVVIDSLPDDGERADRSSCHMVRRVRLRERPDPADARRQDHLRRLQGRVRPHTTSTTGQEQHFWINPQQRYGKNPKDMKFRFVRQAPIEVDPHNPKIVYHGSQFLHKTIDGGAALDEDQPRRDGERTGGAASSPASRSRAT